MDREQLVLSVSEFVAFANQTLEYAYPSVIITGELTNFRISKNKWVYFDLKDEEASLRFFGTVFSLRGPLEDGMMLKVRGTPRLHPQFGFSITFQQIELLGEGTINRASQLLQAKLATEGLFDISRKRAIPYPPKTIGLITSSESAGFADFIKILKARWSGLDITLYDVQVQGQLAPEQIVQAINACNQHHEPPDVLVIVRGGGSAEDLQAFSEESVVRAVASSRIPTLVAIGHEIDISLAELAADQRASTPSNAAELLVPDKTNVNAMLSQQKLALVRALQTLVEHQQEALVRRRQNLVQATDALIERSKYNLTLKQGILAAFNPELALARGYAIVRYQGQALKSSVKPKTGDIVEIDIYDIRMTSEVKSIQSQNRKK